MTDGRTGLVWVVLAVCLSSVACAARAGEPAAPTTAPVAAELKPSEEGDCPAICAKLFQCQHGPWKTDADCRLACEAAIDDETSARTYRCAAAATSCAGLRQCGR